MAKEKSGRGEIKIGEIAQSHYAEAAVVGSCLLDPSMIPLIFENCSISDFVDVDMALFMEGIKDLWEQDTGVDGLLLRQWLEDKGKMTDERFDKLKKVLESVPSAANGIYYARIVQEKRFERDLINSADRLARSVYDKSLSIQEKRELFEQAALTLSLDEGISEAKLVTIARNTWEKIQEPESQLSIATGYSELDEVVGGIEPGQLVIIGGRPSCGKTTMAGEMALNISQRRPVLFLSLEMNRESLCERILANITKISLKIIKGNVLDEVQRANINLAVEKLEKYDLYIDDTPALSPSALTVKVLKAKAAYNISCVFVDYLQLMRIPKWRSENRVTEVTRICSDIKAAAKRARLPIILLSQLSRAPEQRSDPEPRLSDLRESGAIEQDADVVLLLYERKVKADLPKGYKGFESKQANVLTCKVAKNRQGIRDVKVDLFWGKEYFSLKEPLLVEDKNLPI